jgi:Fe-S oxidoreductase
MKSITKGLKALPRTRVDKIRWRGWPRQPTDKNPAKTHVFTDSCAEANKHQLQRYFVKRLQKLGLTVTIEPAIGAA